ncbi:OPT oligopeptide transporter protein-domain-containing protein [Podospora didyma]|uniref:OPT oligopeptide transporter protein-domain-containing protein n=1 Tax=Podospora didyma TaxID=330526 RepID=A0AAE0NR11_9PEZI|nr:OPT oligopeptide transporter protein-domain-containing protein [Podospora didyma]
MSAHSSITKDGDVGPAPAHDGSMDGIHEKDGLQDHGSIQEKPGVVAGQVIEGDVHDQVHDEDVEIEFNVTERDLYEAKAMADAMSLADVRSLMDGVLKIHKNDPNFPQTILNKTIEFLENKDIVENPQNYEELIYEMKIEAALITNNSPYSEVRAVVDNHDDVNIPSLTIRTWIMGLAFAIILCFVNQLFSVRWPAINISSSVAQLLAYPIGKACERFLPDVGFTLFGVRHSLNPGRFSKKEHMLITIMASCGNGSPYTNNIIWIQYLPDFFNQAYAGQILYQLLIGTSTSLIGYGMAGLTRRFLVYPSYCVWPQSLVTIAMNAAFHDDANMQVEGPFKRIYRRSRYNLFLWVFLAAFIYYWFPAYIFTALSVFNWPTWIAPDNLMLTAITGMNHGLGINPLPTFDWNVVMTIQNPLNIPFFSTLNQFLGMVVSGFALFAIWFTNAFHTGYLPINSNQVFDNTGNLYDISMAVDEHSHYDPAKYGSYSPAYLGAGNITVYMFFFAVYPATIVYVMLNHRHEVLLGFKNLWNTIRNKDPSEAQYKDIHNRLMSKYPEVPEWWFTILLVIAVGCGLWGILGWETYTTPGVIFYGLLLCIVFVVPIGIVCAITGVEVTLNVLAEFIGGSVVPGNALAMNFFKSFGYVTCASAISFAGDLKLGHYVKIPPRDMFWAQVIPTLVSIFVSIGVLNFQMNDIPGICTAKAPNRMICPNNQTFFTASVLWGTIGPKKIFGAGGQYVALMAAWPLGALVPLIFWLIRKKFPGQTWLRQIHPVVLLYGGLNWAPMNMAYMWPTIPIGYLSWIYLKTRFLDFWAKYNFVLSAALSVGIGLAAVIIFFALQYDPDRIGTLDWWGNTVSYQGCEAWDQPDKCRLLVLEKGQHFGPGPGEFPV